jgi:hypothetical protein
MGEIDDDRSAELDGMRIQQLATLRRSAYRSRSYAVIAMLVCIIAMAQAALLLIQYLMRIGWGWQPILYAMFVVAGAWGGWFFMRRAMALHREAKQSYLEFPTTPPDFSTLGDGSQRWKNLEEIR